MRLRKIMALILRINHIMNSGVFPNSVSELAIEDKVRVASTRVNLNVANRNSVNMRLDHLDLEQDKVRRE